MLQRRIMQSRLSTSTLEGFRRAEAILTEYDTPSTAPGGMNCNPGRQPARPRTRDLRRRARRRARAVPVDCPWESTSWSGAAFPRSWPHLIEARSPIERRTQALLRHADEHGCIPFASKPQKCGKNASACGRLHVAGAPGSVRAVAEAWNQPNPIAGSRPAGRAVRRDEDGALVGRANIERSQWLRRALTGSVGVLESARKRHGHAFWPGPDTEQKSSRISNDSGPVHGRGRSSRPAGGGRRLGSVKPHDVETEEPPVVAVRLSTTLRIVNALRERRTRCGSRTGIGQSVERLADLNGSKCVGCTGGCRYRAIRPDGRLSVRDFRNGLRVPAIGLFVILVVRHAFV